MAPAAGSAPICAEIEAAVAALKAAKRPLIIAGGGVLYSEAEALLAQFAERCGIPVAETQAGKSSLPAGHAAESWAASA